MMEQNNALFNENQPIGVSEEEKITIHDEADDILISEEVSSDQAEDFIAAIEEMDVEKGESNQKIRLVKPHLPKTQADEYYVNRPLYRPR